MVAFIEHLGDVPRRAVSLR